MNDPTVRRISECFMKPKYTLEEHKHPCFLTPWDLALLSVHYIQKGLLFPTPPSPQQDTFSFMDLLEKLKNSLSLTLVHFYPLSGRLRTLKTDDSASSCVVFVDSNDSPGAGFVHAQIDVTVSDITSAVYVPLVIQSFFDHDRAVSYDGHIRPLLTIQVTELIDGIFIGCSMNHCVGDGTLYWNFLNTWSYIFRSDQEGNSISISRPPVMKRWFPDGHGPVINLPFKDLEQVISRFESPLLKERIFHFLSESIAKLKARANADHNTNNTISSFQSLSALVWRCITQARHLPHFQTTSCKMAINNRSRLNPPLPESYFGNSIYAVGASTTAGELLEKNVGWAAWQLHQAVIAYNDKAIRDGLESWMKSPIIYKHGEMFNQGSVMMGSSPRFNKYGNEFGLGKTLAIQSGYANKFGGKVTAYPGREGGGSVDLEVCLPPHEMCALESDDDFMNAVTL